MNPSRLHPVVAAGLIVLALGFARAASSKESDIDAYARRMPATLARAGKRWVKVWYDGTRWWIAWSAVDTYVDGAGRTRALKLYIKGRVDRVGDGEIEEVVSGGRGLARVLDKVEQNKKSFYFEAPLTPLARTLQFRTTAKKLKFSFNVDGRRNPQDILIGEKGQSPKRMPFTLKTPEAPAAEKGSPRGPRLRRRLRR